MKDSSSSRPTIGMLTDWSENPYQTILRDGVIDAIEARDANLICFVGGALGSSRKYESQRNILFDLVDRRILDGLVISSASIGHFISHEKMTGFCTRFCEIPITSIAMSIPKVPSVLVDNTPGMLKLMDHLIVHHKFKKIAFIKGPVNNEEAESRFNLYKESLEKYGIPYDSNIVVQGDFILKSGIYAMKDLLDKRDIAFDAVIACNDEMAFGALSELQARGINVPGEVAIAGFDDVEESKYYSPALTTVRQPLYKQAKKAAELLLDMIEGKEVPSTVYLPTELIIRESCGCLAQELLEISSSDKKFSGKEDKVLLKDQRGSLVEELDSFVSEYFRSKKYTEPKESAFPSGWSEKFFDSFYSDLLEGVSGEFLHALNAFLFSINFSDNIIHLWQRIITLFRKDVLPCLNDHGNVFRAENLWNQARIMIADVTHRYESIQRLQIARKDQSMRDLSEKLTTKIELEPLLEVLTSELPKVGIQSCYLSLYESEAAYDKARLILGVNEKKRITGAGEEIAFFSRELIPGGIHSVGRRSTFIVEALFHGNDQLGFVLFEFGPHDGRVYEMLRIRLSGALQGTLLFSQLQQQANILENEVKKRTADLIRTNEQLQQEIVERKHAEEELKKSNEELEQFAYIASHDLQEPLRMIGSFVGLLARRYQDKIDQNANEYIEFVVDGVNRMKGMINDLLTYSRVKTRAKEKEPVDLHKKLEEAVQALQIVIEEAGANLIYDKTLPTLPADGTQMRQLFQNLLSNAIKFRGEEAPVIHVGMEDKGEEVLFYVRDNGIGMEEEYSENIFIMFKRLHTRDEYPGTGIGLAICKKIVDLHGGRIWVESEPGKGSIFYFTIPKAGDN